MSAFPFHFPRRAVALGRANARGADQVTTVMGASGGLSGWALQQAVLPLIVFLVINVWLLGFGGDRWIADHIYAWEGGQWALRGSFWTSKLIHNDGKRLVFAASAVLVGMCIAAWRKPGWTPLRRPLVTLVLSVMASTLVVSILKHLTHMDCPWDLSAYGGTRDYVGLFASRPMGMKASGCFPAGHSSSGYAWVALYFFFATVRPRWRWFGLGTGLLAGLVFGVSQQLRGAHFMSHDVWTLMICWLIALTLYRMRRRRWPETHVRERSIGAPDGAAVSMPQ